MSVSDSDSGGIPLNGTATSGAPPPHAPISTTTKRKRGQAEAPTSPEKKTPKRKKTKKGKPHDDGDVDLEAGLNLAIAKMDPPLLADYVAQRTKRFEKDLSSIELEDKYISSKCVLPVFGKLSSLGGSYRESIHGHHRMAEAADTG
jgi:protein CMS1